tara:strand:- start:7429 stop:8004 length:576 start_codon:yes stop_codon:yes gene_type:complete
MAAVASAYGFVPVNRLGGYEGGSFRQIKMTNSFNTNMFFGDIAIIVAAGTIEDGQAASPTRPIGVFMGCSFTDPNLNYKLFSQMWTASTSATDILAHIADDPDQVMQAQADGTVAQADLGLNMEQAWVTGNTSLGKSKSTLDQSGLATTATFPFRVVDFVDGPDSSIGDDFTDCLVTWVGALHAYRVAAGL